MESTDTLVIVLDFDQTLGDFDCLLQAICYFVHCLEENPYTKWQLLNRKLECVRSFIASIITQEEKKGRLIRPGMRSLMVYLDFMKGFKITKIFIITAAAKLDPKTLAGHFFELCNTTPQELIFQFLAGEHGSGSPEKSFLDGIFFTNGQLKSLEVLGVAEDTKANNLHYIIFDDIPYQTNYKQDHETQVLNTQSKKRKRFTTSSSSLSLMHCQVAPYYDKKLMTVEQIMIYILDTYKHFSGMDLEGRVHRVYAESLKKKLLSLQNKREKEVVKTVNNKVTSINFKKIATDTLLESTIKDLQQFFKLYSWESPASSRNSLDRSGSSSSASSSVLDLDCY